MRVIFNHDRHFGRWYKKGEEGDLPYRLAVRLINLGIVHPAPEPKPVIKTKRKSKSRVESKTVKKKASPQKEQD